MGRTKTGYGRRPNHPLVLLFKLFANATFYKFYRRTPVYKVKHLPPWSEYAFTLNGIVFLHEDMAASTWERPQPEQHRVDHELNVLTYHTDLAATQNSLGWGFILVLVRSFIRNLITYRNIYTAWHSTPMMMLAHAALMETLKDTHEETVEDNYFVPSGIKSTEETIYQERI